MMRLHLPSSDLPSKIGLRSRLGVDKQLEMTPLQLHKWLLCISYMMCSEQTVIILSTNGGGAQAHLSLNNSVPIKVVSIDDMSKVINIEIDSHISVVHLQVSISLVLSCRNKLETIIIPWNFSSTDRRQYFFHRV